VRHLRRRGALPRFDDERFAAAVAAASAAKAPVELLLPLVEKTCGAEGLETAAAIATLGIRTPAAAKKDIAAFLRGLERPAIERAKLERYLMGLVMEKFRGAIPGKLIAEMVSASAG
jgi:Glu-tRNA(Gln) amidotransferase subunit E-like FAD-binding protein